MPALVRKCAGEPLEPLVDRGASPNHELNDADGTRTIRTVPGEDRGCRSHDTWPVSHGQWLMGDESWAMSLRP